MERPELGWEQHCQHPLPTQTILGVLESLGFLAREQGEGQRVPCRTRSQGAEGMRSSGMSQLPTVQTLNPHSCDILGAPQTVHTGMCSGGGWPQDGGLVPSWRPRGCIQRAQPEGDRVRILRSFLGVSEVGRQCGYLEYE